MTHSEIMKIDSENMYDILKSFPRQIKEANEIGINAPGFSKKVSGSKFMVMGMGGSAIGGSILKSYLSALDGAGHIKIDVNRNYMLPEYIGRETNFIASSYSGGTEETISAFEKACDITHNIISITTGGKLRKMSEDSGLPVINIPSGMQPRCAIAYSFFPMLRLIIKTGLMEKPAVIETEEAIEELLTYMEAKTKLYADFNNPDNTALKLAKKLQNKIPVIYSSSDIIDSVNLRWRGQVQENAKIPAFGNFLPEMNHNEINGWTADSSVTSQFSIILIRDKSDHIRVKARFDALEKLLTGEVDDIITVHSDAGHILTRIFDLIHLGDWVSYYLAIINNTDPTPIPLISRLKDYLSNA